MPGFSRFRLLAAILVVVVLASGVWFYRYRQSPAYALTRLAAAIEARDPDRVHDYLDVKAASAQIVDGVIQTSMAKSMQESSSEGGFAALGAALGSAMVDRMKPALATMLELAIDSPIAPQAAKEHPFFNDVVVATHGHDTPSTPVVMSNILQRLREGGTTLERVGRVRVHRDSATVDLRLRHADLDTTLVLSVAMRRTDGPWRVVGFDNIAVYLATIDAVQVKRLAAANAPIETRLASMLRIENFGVDHVEIGYNDWLKLHTLVHNTSKDTIIAMLLKLDGPPVQASGLVGFVHGDSEPPLPPDAPTTLTWIMEYNQFMDGQKTLRYLPTSFTPKLEFAIVRSGTRVDTVMVYQTWGDFQLRTRHHSRSARAGH